MNNDDIDNNPLLTWGRLPDFQAIDATHVEPAMKVVLERAHEGLTALEAAVGELPIAEVVGRLEELEDRLGYTWGLVNHLNSVRTNDALRAAIQAVQPEVVRFSARIGQSETIYRAYEEALALGIGEPALKRVVELGLRAMRHSGIGLSGDTQTTFNTNQEALAELGLAYGNALVDSTRAWSKVLTSEHEVAGLPVSLKALLAQSAAMAGLTGEDAAGPTPEHGPWRLTLDAPCVVPFLEYAERADLREALYRAYIGRAGPEGDPQHDNTARVLEILRVRKAQAGMLGFEDFAAYSLDAKMAPSVEVVQRLLASLHGKSMAAAERELDELRGFARECGVSADLELWDVGYWARRLREARYAYSDEDLKPYFPLPAVLDGAFALVKRLFGVTIAKKDGVVGWHPDVTYYEVKDGDAVVASFFLDPYSRPADKRSGAWMNELRGRSARLGGVVGPRTPIAYLVCNQAPPVGDAPSLMTWNEVSTLFHELGHGLQHMLTTVDLLAVSGINGVEWDAVELPSQFMENFLRHKAFLRSFARHFETGEPIPDVLVDKVLAASKFRAGSAFLRQLYFGRLDLALHTGEPPADDKALWGLMHKVARDNTVIQPLPTDRFLCSFGHLFAGGYAAGYYSYKWAEVLSGGRLRRLRRGRPRRRTRPWAEVGRRFRDTVLGLGGSVAPMDVSSSSSVGASRRPMHFFGITT
jgi:oligopeptidase A